MIVMKFGGTSVGVPEHFLVARRLVREAASRDPVVVVSALSGVTNLLPATKSAPAAHPTPPTTYGDPVH